MIKLEKKFSGTLVLIYLGKVSKIILEPGFVMDLLFKQDFSMILLSETIKSHRQIMIKLKSKLRNTLKKNSFMKEFY